MVGDGPGVLYECFECGDDVEEYCGLCRRVGEDIIQCRDCRVHGDMYAEMGFEALCIRCWDEEARRRDPEIDDPPSISEQMRRGKTCSTRGKRPEDL